MWSFKEAKNDFDQKSFITLDLKDGASSRFGHSDVVFDFSAEESDHIRKELPHCKSVWIHYFYDNLYLNSKTISES